MALAFLYGTVGTLNMAHISVRVMEAGANPLITTVALIFLIVFSLKAGLLLFFWLRGSYSVPPTAIAALFAALLTKVGIMHLYVVLLCCSLIILRSHTQRLASWLELQ